MSSLGTFLATARTEVARYGDDDDVFVRELVQNARDAGARRIAFSRRDDDDDNEVGGMGIEAIIVDDDGAGMSRDVVTGSLLRLFSSHKDREVGAAGCFGVGFWSVLRFADVDVTVETCDGHASCALRIDLVHETLTELPAPPSRQSGQKGTRVTLRRRRRVDEARFALRTAILAHASHVTGSGGPPPRLELLARDGTVELLNRPLQLGPEVLATRTIDGDGFRGVVGLSASPRIELLHHGLRVVTASSLMALVPSKKQAGPRGLGLSAQIDVDTLTVLVDRKTVVEDDRLRAVVDACDDAARKLERDALDDAAPLPPLEAVLHGLRRFFTSTPLRLAAVGFVTIVLGATLGFGGLWIGRPDLRGRIPVDVIGSLPRGVVAALPAAWTSALTGAPASSRRVAPAVPRALDDAIGGFDSPRIDVRGPDAAGWDVDVEGIGTGQLRLFSLSLPDDARGLAVRPLRLRTVGPSPSSPSGSSPQARAAFRVARAGPVGLPSSTTLWPTHVTEASGAGDAAGRRTAVTDVDEDGLPVFIASGPGVVTVELGAAPPPRTPPRVVPVTSSTVRALIAPADGLDGQPLLDALVAEVQRRVRYAADADSARAFDADRRPFVDRALALGRGDCDVINTVLVRALQAAGFEARLAVGLVVVDDAVADDLHAWAEVRFDDGHWETVDASPPEARPRPLLATTQAARRSPIGATAGATQAAMKPATLAPATRLGLAGLAAIIGGALVVGAVVGISRRRRRAQASPRADVLPLFLAGLQSGAAERLGLRRRPFLPTVDHDLLTLDEATALFGSGRLARGTARPAWLDDSVAVLDSRDERVRALRPFLPPAVDVDAVAFRESATLQDVQAHVDACVAGVRLRAAANDAANNPAHNPANNAVGVGAQGQADVQELHLRSRGGGTHLVLVPPSWLNDPALAARVLDAATCLRGLQDGPRALPPARR